MLLVLIIVVVMIALARRGRIAPAFLRRFAVPTALRERSHRARE
jgi:hypothetical protein